MSILKIEKLNTYYGKSHILQGVDFDLNKTGCLALLGRNGAGKSTTLRSIVNLTKPVSGKITFNNIDLEGLSTYEIAEIGLTMVPENRGMFSSLSVLVSLCFLLPLLLLLLLEENGTQILAVQSSLQDAIIDPSGDQDTAFTSSV